MAAPVINRLVLTDDDGSGMTGTPLNNALFQDLQNRIDALSAALYDSTIAATFGHGVGDIVIMSGPLRTGFIEADGMEYQRTALPALNAFYGSMAYPFGAGNGSTTFLVPDLRGRVPVGVGTAPGLSAWNLNTKFGSEQIALDVTQIPAHAHPITDQVHAHPITDVQHNHVVSELAHKHTINDPGHAHTFTELAGGGSSVYVQTGGFTNPNGNQTTNPSATGITMDYATAGIGIVPSGSGITATNQSGTGITTTNNAGGGAGHYNIQPSIGMRYAIKT